MHIAHSETPEAVSDRVVAGETGDAQQSMHGAIAAWQPGMDKSRGTGRTETRNAIRVAVSSIWLGEPNRNGMFCRTLPMQV